MYKKFIFIISLILFIIINFYSYNKNNELTKVQETLDLQKFGLKKLSILNDINILLKEYRGLSQLNDKDSFILQSKYERMIILVDSLPENEFKKKFLSLIKIDTQNEQQLFYEYTKAINYIESMIIKIANEDKLFALANKDTYKYMSAMVYSIPKMIETVGKVRGMGISAISNQKLSKIEKFILNDNLNTFYLYINNLPLSDDEFEEMNFIYQDLKISLHELVDDKFRMNVHLYYEKHTVFIQTIYGYYYALHNKFDDILIENQKKIYDDNKTNISYYFFYMVFLLIATVFSFDKLNRYEDKKSLDSFEYSTINLLYEKFTYAHDLKDICDISTGFLVEHLHATNGQLYIVDRQNKKLSLASTYNLSAKHLQHILDMEEGIFSEVLKSKEIKVLDSTQRLKVDFGSFKAYLKKIVTIPLMSDDGVIVAMVQLNFLEDVNLYKRFENIFKIIANNIVKSQKNEENEKYFNLIDRYVITSTTNKEGIITYASKAFSEISGYKREELIGKSHSILKHQDVNPKIYENLWSDLNAGKTWTNELLNKNKDGSSYWVKATISPEFGFYGDIVGFTSIREDITDKKTIEEISITDSLTSLYNRRHFDIEFKKQLDIAKTKEKKLAFCMIDIDHFKQYNDTYGHQEGDAVLKKVADVLRSSLRKDTDMVFRLGGEEFGILFFVDNSDIAYNIANNIRKLVEKSNILHEANSISDFITVSIGLYVYDKENFSNEDIYKKADELLYMAKKAGRNRVNSNKKDI